MSVWLLAKFIVWFVAILGKNPRCSKWLAHCVIDLLVYAVYGGDTLTELENLNASLTRTYIYDRNHQLYERIYTIGITNCTMLHS